MRVEDVVNHHRHGSVCRDFSARSRRRQKHLAPYAWLVAACQGDDLSATLRAAEYSGAKLTLRTLPPRLFMPAGELDLANLDSSSDEGDLAARRAGLG